MTDLRRLEVVRVAESAEGRGPEVCQSAAPGLVLAPAHGGAAWCQIFWLWCLRECGLTDLTWSGVARRGWVAGWLPTTRDPQPGDMAYDDQPFQHGAVVVSVTDDGRSVTTIDGNSTGGVVVRRVRPRAEWTAFYSLAPLLGAERPAESPAMRLQLALTLAGYPCGQVDGRIGPRTRAALEAWAIDHPDRVL